MEKHLIDRRMEQMRAEGVTFLPNTEIGLDVSTTEVLKTFDAMVLTGGSETPRNLQVPGRELQGVHFAMDFLTQQNRRVSREDITDNNSILAGGKHVVVIGGGDTGSDCVGTSIRQGAASVTQLEVMPRPPEVEDKALNWPNWPLKLRTSSSHLEGAERDWSVATKSFTGNNGRLTGLNLVRNEWRKDSSGGFSMAELPDTQFHLKADLVLLAMGFVHPKSEGLVSQLGVELDDRGNVKADETSYKTSRKDVFVAGDMRRGQSLVVWAIKEGRRAARAVDEHLMGTSTLPD
tara:strand:- start:198 stop:1070 length:873 start_codon:yes stop_codon:yes gene_type:complete